MQVPVRGTDHNERRNMKEYKSSLFVIGKNVVYGVGGGFVAALVLSWFISAGVAVVLGCLAGLAIIYFAVIGDNIRVTLDDDTLAIYRLGKLKHSFKVAECSFNAKIVTTTGSAVSDSDCDLTIADAGGEETTIDCSMLGRSRFLELLDDLGFNDQAPSAVPTTKAN